MRTRNTKLRDGAREKAFTLIELMVVIAIIALIAAMLTGLSGLAARKKHEGAVTAMKNKLMLCISSYQSKMGFYPPDNANNVLWPADSSNYEYYTGRNPLLYELTGAAVNPTNLMFLVFDSSLIPAATFSGAYGRGGIANSVADEERSYYQPLPSPSEYMVCNGLKQLVVPVPLTGAANELNWWHYDSSTTNRHNPLTFDLWAEYSAGKDSAGNRIIITNGNW
ncbi:MAG: prepilin-type N-terminal cleavage/methylation domain-containing protein [Verrucomicrobiota bacterium]